MKTMRTVIINAALLFTFAGAAAAAPSASTADKRSAPSAIKETVIISDASPAARHAARALEATDRRLAVDAGQVRTAEARLAGDRLALAQAEREVTVTRHQWDLDVARHNANAAARDAERHHVALVQRNALRADLRATQGRDEAVEHDRDRAVTALGAEQVEAKQIMRGDLKADGR